MHRYLLATCRAVCLALCCGAVAAEDGYELWLRYAELPPELAEPLAGRVTAIAAPASRSATTRAAVDELARGFGGLLGRPLPFTAAPVDGAILIGTPSSDTRIRALGLPLGAAGDNGYVIRSIAVGGNDVTVVAANTDVGVLYGAFALLRLAQGPEPLAALDVAAAPAVELRLLNHWDNLDRTVERGYAGRSLWDWMTLPEHADPRYVDYARANASLGINGAVLNNVNANAEILTPLYIEKVAALADVFRPYGIRVYLSARFDAPMELGGLDTADPLDRDVARWWADKAAEIYTSIPDFGGFLVKANSEGQPGPQDYGRSHADGANMLAAAVGRYGGVVIWRAFVYSAENAEDRAKQAYSEFVPLDGRFADNVLVQVKNGPIDFQPREPFHPLFGAMLRTPVMAELQITKEYLGFASHLVYLGPLFEEFLDADTQVDGPGSTVARIVDGTVHGYPVTGIAGVANTGTDRDWTGSPFNQANWYAFGRLAWDPSLPADAIAGEWLRTTFSREPEFVAAATRMMLRSREAVVDYMTPLGLAHLMGTGHHYGPAPWVAELSRPEWNPVYYHRADGEGIGFDRTAAGSDAVSQYAGPVAAAFADLERVDERLLLWFHRVPWDYETRSGRTLWHELVARYDRGVAEVEAMQATWASLADYVDAERFAKQSALLAVQLREARWWRDASIAYFQRLSGRALPDGVAPPEHPLEHYRSLRVPEIPR